MNKGNSNKFINSSISGKYMDEKELDPYTKYDYGILKSLKTKPMNIDGVINYKRKQETDYEKAIIDLKEFTKRYPQVPNEPHIDFTNKNLNYALGVRGTVSDSIEVINTIYKKSGLDGVALETFKVIEKKAPNLAKRQGYQILKSIKIPGWLGAGVGYGLGALGVLTAEDKKEEGNKFLASSVGGLIGSAVGLPTVGAYAGEYIYTHRKELADKTEKEVIKRNQVNWMSIKDGVVIKKDGTLDKNQGVIERAIRKHFKLDTSDKKRTVWKKYVPPKDKEKVISASSVLDGITTKTKFTLPTKIKSLTEGLPDDDLKSKSNDKKLFKPVGWLKDIAYSALFNYNPNKPELKKSVTMKKNKKHPTKAAALTYKKYYRSTMPRYTGNRNARGKASSRVSYNRNKRKNPVRNILNNMLGMAKKMFRNIYFNPLRLLKPRKHANGGIINERMLTWAGEEGSEAIIPLTASRRDRGLELWKKTGKMLGVYPNAKSNIKNAGLGGISGQSHSVKKDRGGKQSNSQINIGGVTIQLTTTNTDGNLVNMINAQKEEIANTISGIIAEALESGFENLPVSVA